MTRAAASPLDMLKPLAGRALQAALNRAVALDPETAGALRALEGRRIGLTLASPALALELRVVDGALVVAPPDDAREADLSVSSTLGGLLSQLPALMGAGGHGASRASSPTGRLRISGDAELAQSLQRLATRFDPDWQRPFVAVFGEVLGVQIANAIATALRQARALGASLAESAADYVTEESRDVVPRAEVAAFSDDVDGLRDDVDRLAARIARLGTAGGAR